MIARITPPEVPAAKIPKLALRRAEAAEALGISERTLSEWVASGAIPFVKRNKVLMFPVHLLKKWLTEQSNETASAAVVES